MMAMDYTEITELPGAALTDEQFARFCHRYALGAELAAHRRVLEVACGAGSGLGYLAQGRVGAAGVIGLDYSAPVLHAARMQYGGRIPLVRGDARALPFCRAAFDLVLCFEAIYYLGDYEAFLRESARVLAPGGILLLCQSNPDWPDFVPGNFSVHYPSVPELATSLMRAGFARVELSGILPTTTVPGPRSLVNRLRRVVLRSSLVPRALLDHGPLADLLKRITYGRLVPLPAELDDATVEAAAGSVVATPLATDRPDCIHRVIYARATL
jgi:ubiquinone/menaquinone biosynthesis C-methylase UbiE